jgi:hypothetical protein
LLRGIEKGSLYIVFFKIWVILEQILCGDPCSKCFWYLLKRDS